MNNETTKEPKQKGFFAAVERVGNKMPHPAILFIYLTIFIMVLSCILHLTGATAVHPSTGETITPVNMLSIDGLKMFLTSFVDNFQSFPILGVVVVFAAITAICEKTGFLPNLIKVSISGANGNAVVLIVAFISVLSKMAGDVCQILMPILAAELFYQLGRHPLAGAFCAYAASSAGFATALIPASAEVITNGITVTSAQLLLPDFDMPVLSSYFGLLVNYVVISILTMIVTVRFVEPRLGKYTGTPEGLDEAKAEGEVTAEERKALKKAGIAVLIYLAVLVVICIPKNSFMRNAETGSLLYRSTLMSSFTTIVALLFFIPGVVYGRATGQIKKGVDIIKLMTQGVAGMAGFITMAIIIGQFLVVFSSSKIGTIAGIKGGDLLSSSSMPKWLIVALFILLVAVINILIASKSTKYLILAPVFVPMLMQLNIHPAFTQWLYYIGDGITNLITPLDVVFVMLLATCQKYDKKVGFGTMFTYLIPYSAVYYIVLAVIAIIWMYSGLNIGVGGPIFLN